MPHLCQYSLTLVICLVLPKHPRVSPPAPPLLCISEAGQLPRQLLLISLNLSTPCFHILNCPNLLIFWFSAWKFLSALSDCTHWVQLRFTALFSGYCDQSSWRSIPNYLPYSWFRGIALLTLDLNSTPIHPTELSFLGVENAHI